jgi:transposase
MYIKHCKLRAKEQLKLIEFFVAETTARTAAEKVPVFGLLKRGGKVYAQIINDAQKSTLMPIIREKIMPDSIVYTDSFKAYNALDISESKHYRINHSKLFADKHNHINGIENFWNQAKRYPRKLNGIPKEHFYLFLKDLKKLLKELY